PPWSPDDVGRSGYPPSSVLGRRRPSPLLLFPACQHAERFSIDPGWELRLRRYRLGRAISRASNLRVRGSVRAGQGGMRAARIPNDREGIMKSLGQLAAIAMVSLWASGAHAAGTCNLGSGRVTNVQSVGVGCVSGPTGGSVQSWDVQQGQGYQV